jgi:acetyltransferase-like isoleucine patch superfamily enzyme
MAHAFNEKLQRSGLFELFWIIVSESFNRFTSLVKIFFLRLRGFTIDYSVLFGYGTLLFQSNKNAIQIDKNTQIGHGVRLKAGFDGKIMIGKNVLIDDYSFVSAQESIIIGDDTMIAANAYIADFNHKYPLTIYKKFIDKKEGYERRAIKIGSGVWIGTHAVILPGVDIGNGAVIGAGAIVTKNIPSFSVAVGNPAKVVK